jgi:hypothetical protein
MEFAEEINLKEAIKSIEGRNEFKIIKTLGLTSIKYSKKKKN